MVTELNIYVALSVAFVSFIFSIRLALSLAES
jgi:photosystem I reaction center subunit XII